MSASLASFAALSSARARATAPSSGSRCTSGAEAIGSFASRGPRRLGFRRAYVLSVALVVGMLLPAVTRCTDAGSGGPERLRIQADRRPPDSAAWQEIVMEALPLARHRASRNSFDAKHQILGVADPQVVQGLPHSKALLADDQNVDLIWGRETSSATRPKAWIGPMICTAARTSTGTAS